MAERTPSTTARGICVTAKMPIYSASAAPKERLPGWAQASCTEVTQ